ncbi:MAG: sulfite exporter TauE/SafE family protein [Methanomicrobiales archaeon]|nr:sulfite exporter TauE/SafE family protein [Methanomicrobiales archaeon]
MMDPILVAGILVLTGAVAGVFAGLMGVGGGFLMVPVQYALLTASGMEGTLATRVAFGTSLAVILPTAVVATWGHHRKSAVDWQAAVTMGLAAVGGSLLGGTLASFTPGHVLRAIFGVVLLLMAGRMLLDLRECSECPLRGGLPEYLLLGFLIGMISGLAGIGGGTLAVPLMVIFLGFPMYRAVGTSAACLIFSAAGGVTAYALHGAGVAGLPPGSLGYLYLPWWALLVVTTIPFTLAGVRGAYVLGPQRLRKIFALVLAGIALAMFLTG